MIDGFELELFDHLRHDRSTFDCGEPSLNDYLNKAARQDIKRRLARLYVIAMPNDPERLIYGYFTLSAHSIGLNQIPSEVSAKLPKYELVPSILIGRLAKNKNQTEISGGNILDTALLKSKIISEHVGARFVAVECLNQRAKDFYLKFGFIELRDPMKLVLPMDSIF